jgi:putative transposase
LRSNGRLYVAKVGELPVRWSRDLPSEPSSVTSIREPDGNYCASFVVDMPARPLPEVEREAGVDVGIARLATIVDTAGVRIDVPNPKHLQPAWQGRSGAAGLSPQAGPGVGSR